MSNMTEKELILLYLQEHSIDCYLSQGAFWYHIEDDMYLAGGTAWCRLTATTLSIKAWRLSESMEKDKNPDREIVFSWEEASLFKLHGFLDTINKQS